VSDIVIGSGPAGISAAWSLIQQGRTVTMLDIGERLEQANNNLKETLSKSPPNEWSADDISAYTNLRQASQIDGALPYGSDFLFRDKMNILGTRGIDTKIGLRASFAKGGLSNGWGSAILPYRIEDLSGWPISSTDLSKHYNALREFMPMAGKADDLDKLFPMQAFPTDTSLTTTQQAEKLLYKLQNKKEQLNNAGVYFGKARQAASSSDCHYCKMCLYGCPYNTVYNSAKTVEKLCNHPNFTYIDDLAVTHFKEQHNQVQVKTVNTNTYQEQLFSAKRLYIACGVLPTAKLVLESLNQFDKTVLLKDSQHFFLPMLHTWGTGQNVKKENKNTLAQVFIEMILPELNNLTAHAQLYTYNDLYPIDMRKRFGFLAKPLSPLINLLSQRLIVAQGFLHSDDSAAIELSLKKNDDGNSSLNMTPKENPQTNQKITLFRKKLSKMALNLGLVPLTPLSRSGSIGSSFHCGSTFPMSDNPSPLESDTLGRPAGLQRVHIVDASVFPSIPATTITLTVMANAHRIAEESSKIDS